MVSIDLRQLVSYQTYRQSNIPRGQIADQKGLHFLLTGNFAKKKKNSLRIIKHK